MKIIVVGTGTIGAAVISALQTQHEVIAVSRHTSPALDLQSVSSIKQLFQQVKDVQHVVSCAGGAAWKPLAELTEEDFGSSLNDKLMGQVNLARIALQHVKDSGSITLTSGVLAQNPMVGSAAVSLVNSGLEGFVRAAALEAGRGVRVNVVSPPWVTETLEQMGMDKSHGLPAADVAKAYVGAIEGSTTGQVIQPQR